MIRQSAQDSPARGSLSRSSWIPALAVVVAASFAAGYVVFVKLIPFYPQPGWDEAKHTLNGALIFHDLRGRDLLAFVLDSYFQVYWPPLHSWLVAAAFLLSGPSLEAARAVSVLSFVLLAPTLFLVARIVEPRHGIVAGCLAAALALTSPGITLLAARAMLELPALLALSITMLIYCVLERNPAARPGAHALLGASVVLTYLVKTNYGVLLVITMILARLIGVRFRLHLLLTRENLYAALPLILFCLIWFAYPLKLVWTWNALVNQPWGGEQGRGLAGLLFFPRVHVDFSGSWWMSLILWTGLAVAWAVRRSPGVSFLALLALTLFLIGEFHHTKLDRHIMPMFPPMFVLTGIAGAALWDWLRAHVVRGRVVAVTVLSCISLFHALSLVHRDWMPKRDRTREAAVVKYVSAQVRENDPALVLNTRGANPGPPVMDWHLVSQDLLPVIAAGSTMNFNLQRWLNRQSRSAPVPARVRSSLRRLLDRYDASSNTRSLHVVDQGLMSQARFEALLTTALRKHPPRTIIAMISTAEAAPYNEAFLSPGFSAHGFRQISVREFPPARTRVYVYRRP